MPRLLLPILTGALVAAPAVLAQGCPNDDPLEPNNNIGQATPSGATPAGVNFAGLVLLDTGSGGGQFDDFSVQLEPGETLNATATFGPTVTTVGLQVLDGSNNSLQFAFSGAGGSETISFVNNTGQANTFFLDVQNTATTGCIEYDLFIQRTFCPGDDNLENFDSCESSFGLGGTSGTLPSLAVLSGDDDYFGLPLMPGETVTARIEFDHSTADVDLQLFDETSGSCGSSIASSTSTADFEEISYTNASAGFQALVLRTYLFNGSCNGYSLTWNVAPADPCFGADMFEPNDDICSPGSSPDFGIYDNLSVSSGDSDFQSQGVINPGNRVTVSIDFVDADGDIDLRLWDVTNGCANAVLLDSSTSTQDFEEVSYENTTGANVALVAEIYFFGNGCNEYRLTEAVSVGVVGIGDNYCFSTPNSTGQRGITRVIGDPVAANNAVSLFAERLPAGQFGLFVVSREPGFVTGLGGGQGNLCLGGTLGRYQRPGEIVQVSVLGAAGLAIDLTDIPQGSVAASAQPGETWFFQFWHRDVVGGAQSSNLADGVRVRFE